MAIISLNARNIYSNIVQVVGIIALFMCIAVAESLIASLKAETKRYRAFRAQFLLIVQVLIILSIRYIWIKANLASKWNNQWCKYYFPTILRPLLTIYLALAQIIFMIGAWLMINQNIEDYTTTSSWYFLTLLYLLSFLSLLGLVIFIDLINYFNLRHHSQELRITNNSKWRALTTMTIVLCMTCVIVFTFSRSVHIQTVHLSLRHNQQGITLAHLSNLHLGPNIDQTHLQNIVKITNSAYPDIIFLHGELFDHQVDQLIHSLQPLKHLRARYGIYYSTGIHRSSNTYTIHFLP